MGQMNTKTLHQPGSWVIGAERQDEPTSGREHRDIASERIVEVEAGHIIVRKDMSGLMRRILVRRPAENNKIMAM